MMREAPWENLGIYDRTIIKGPRGPHCSEGEVVFAIVYPAGRVVEQFDQMGRSVP
jgi:hypothetical protein